MKGLELKLVVKYMRVPPLANRFLEAFKFSLQVVAAEKAPILENVNTKCTLIEVIFLNFQKMIFVMNLILLMHKPCLVNI